MVYNSNDKYSSIPLKKSDYKKNKNPWSRVPVLFYL